MSKSPAKQEGVVSWFSDFKGFGFITDSKGRDVYVNYTEILRDGFKTLVKGERVRFILIDEDQGVKATQVEVLES